MNPEERDDELLKEYLEGDSALSRLYRRSTHEQPGAQLDARILGEARRAVTRKARGAHSPFARHWMIPTSLAAVFVLSLGVVLLMPDPAGGPGIEVDEAASSAPARPRAGDAPGPAADIEQERVPATLPVPAESGMRREQASGVEDSASGGRASAIAPLPSPAGKQRADEASRTTGAKRKAQATQREHIGAGDPQSLTAPASAASVADEAAAPAPAESAQAPARALRSMATKSIQDDPQAWLRFIDVLLNAGNRAGAMSNLRAFRARYPDFPLPARLADLAASLDATPP